MDDLIGITAGKIWQFLNEHGETSILKLKTTLKISNTLACMGLGWLAREDKVTVKEYRKEYKIYLK